jgi:hypothetical protein
MQSVASKVSEVSGTLTASQQKVSRCASLPVAPEVSVCDTSSSLMDLHIQQSGKEKSDCRRY